MMKRFFQALRTISRLTDILIKHYKAHFLSSNGEESVHHLDDGFEIVNQSLRLRKEDVFLRSRIVFWIFFLSYAA